jgi:hypothetical protein
MPIRQTAALDGDRPLASARRRWASLSLCPSYGVDAIQKALVGVGSQLAQARSIGKAMTWSR